MPLITTLNAGGMLPPTLLRNTLMCCNRFIIFDVVTSAMIPLIADVVSIKCTLEPGPGVSSVIVAPPHTIPLLLISVLSSFPNL